jgi:hypothetical protein
MTEVVSGVHPKRLKQLEGALDISAAQSPQWMQFCGAVHAAIRLLPASTDLGGPGRANYPSLPLTIDIEFRHNLVKLESCRALRTHVAELYEVLSDKQRVLADRLLVPILVAVMETTRFPDISWFAV